MWKPHRSPTVVRLYAIIIELYAIQTVHIRQLSVKAFFISILKHANLHTFTASLLCCWHRQRLHVSYHFLKSTLRSVQKFLSSGSCDCIQLSIGNSKGGNHIGSMKVAVTWSGCSTQGWVSYSKLDGWPQAEAPTRHLHATRGWCTDHLNEFDKCCIRFLVHTLIYSSRETFFVW